MRSLKARRMQRTIPPRVKRSGATTKNPWSAIWRAISRCGLRKPNASCRTMTPGQGPSPAGISSTASMLPLGVSMLMSVMAPAFDVLPGLECFGEAGDFVVTEDERASGDVGGEMAARARTRDQEHVVGDRKQPGQRDLRRCGTVTRHNLGDDRVGANRSVFVPRSAERTKRNEAI